MVIQFKVGHVYTHSKMRDVCMLVISVLPVKYGEPRINMKVRWFKKNGLDLGAIDEIVVPETDDTPWSEHEVPSVS